MLFDEEFIKSLDTHYPDLNKRNILFVARLVLDERMKNEKNRLERWFS